MKGIKVYTAEAVWRAQMEEAARLQRELEGTKADLNKQLDQVCGEGGGGRAGCKHIEE